MDLRFTPEETAFREEVREFFRTALPERIRDKLVMGHHASKDELVEWTRILNAKGWAVPHWPVEWGGTGWDPVRQYIFQDEMQQAPAPSPLPFGVSMVGPVIIAFGSEAQKRRFLPRIANLDDWWCQGFSEPGSGSDLASLKTTAKRDGDAYVVTGQKTWTTLGQYADWIFVLARTDMAAKKQEGISFLLIDMKSPGITVRPIRTIDGGEEVNEVFLDDVRVPAENLVGQENKGWDYAKFLLGNERVGIARVGVSKERLRRIKELARLERIGEVPLIETTALSREARRGRDRAQGAGDDAAARRRGRAPSREGQARPGLFDPQDQGLGDPAGDDRAPDGGRRSLRPALPGRARARPERAADRPRLGRPRRADLFQLAQDLDLRRLERDPAEHHRQGDTGALNNMRGHPGRSEAESRDPRPRAGAMDPG